MKPNHRSWQKVFLIACFSIGYAACFAQKPVIREVDKVSGSNGEVVTLQGTFNSNLAAPYAVFFGADEGDILFRSEQLLEVAVPPGATYDKIVVTDLTSGLSDQAESPFLLSFGGNHGITGASLEGQVDFDAESGLYDLCMCDFNGDGKTDVATANQGFTRITILENTTNLPGLSTITFNKSAFPTNNPINAQSTHAQCGDLNGDGKPDLVISENEGNRLYVFRNMSTAGSINFSIQVIPIVNKKVRRIEIADLDNDGKPELIVTHQGLVTAGGTSGGFISILVNESTPAAIAFNSTPITLTISAAASTDGLAVQDLNEDGLPEIIASQFQTGNSDIFIFENQSLPGNIMLTHQQTISIGQTIASLKTGDLDGDGKPEIVATQLGSGGMISILKNLTTAAIAFATPVSFSTGGRAWGLDFGDIDGDGKTDIVVATAVKSITVLNNQSTSSALAFSTLMQPTTYINRHVKVGDVDGDGKPDVVFTSVDDYANGELSSKVSVIRNKHCLVPVIDPAGPITICSGFPLQLTTTASKGATYRWMNGGTQEKDGAEAFLDVTADGNYSVIATSEGGACVETSNTVAVDVDPGSLGGPANPGNDGPVCRGSTATLFADNVGATDYIWTGPNGYTGTGTNPAPITDFQAENAGRYYVDVMLNGCIAEQASTVVEMISVPDFQVSYTGSDVLCPPDTKVLNVVPNDPNFTYTWAERTLGNTGDVGPSTTVSSTGDYYVKAQYNPNPACVPVETEDVTLTFSTPPVADFSVPLTACTDQVLSFVNQSTGDPSLDKFYNWTFGDTQTATDESPDHHYSTANTYTVTLSVSYNNGACADQTSKSITIETAPAASITTPDGNFQVCAGGNLLLEVNGTFDGYQWNTGDASPSLNVSAAGDYTVELTAGSCVITRTVTVASVPGPVVSVTADPAEIGEGGTSQLNATGLTTYSWTPPESLNDAAVGNPVASPEATTVYIVQGYDDNGCPGTAQVEIRVKGDLIVNKLLPSKFISPNNGDVINNFWLIENILNYPQCSVSIYDDKGIKVYDAKPYNNDWDGTYRGRELPDGVYYYIIRCDGEESTPKSGSITVLR